MGRLNLAEVHLLMGTQLASDNVILVVGTEKQMTTCKVTVGIRAVELERKVAGDKRFCLMWSEKASRRRWCLSRGRVKQVQGRKAKGPDHAWPFTCRKRAVLVVSKSGHAAK